MSTQMTVSTQARRIVRALNDEVPGMAVWFDAEGQVIDRYTSELSYPAGAAPARPAGAVRFVTRERHRFTQREVQDRLDAITFTAAAGLSYAGHVDQVLEHWATFGHDITPEAYRRLVDRVDAQLAAEDADLAGGPDVRGQGW